MFNDKVTEILSSNHVQTLGSYCKSVALKMSYFFVK